MLLLLAVAGVCTNYVFTFRPGLAQCGSLLGFFHSLKRGGDKKRASKKKLSKGQSVRAVLRKPKEHTAPELCRSLGVTSALPAESGCLGSLGFEFHDLFLLVPLFLAASYWCNFGDLKAAS